MKELVCLVGIPRSGKTSWARTQGVPMVNPDSIRLAMHGQAFVPQAERLVWATAHLMVEALFLAGHDRVILDSTSVTRERRKEWFAKGWKTYFHLIETPLEVCLDRARQSHFPEEVVRRMAMQFEPLGPDEPAWLALSRDES